jgi:hypothetical protein
VRLKLVKETAVLLQGVPLVTARTG